MTRPVQNDADRPFIHPVRPFSVAEAKQTFEAILTRINRPGNDTSNMDLSRPTQAPVSSAIKFDVREARALTEELAALDRGLARLILDKVLPEKLEPQRQGGLYLSQNAAKHLNETAKAHGVAQIYESRQPILPLAQPIFPGPTERPNTPAIEGIVALNSIQDSAPADKKMVARINDISAKAIAAEAGKGKNVLASAVNILDMIAPVSVSLLSATGDNEGVAAMKKSTLAAMKKDLGGAHLSDQEFVHSLQVIHAQLLQFKDLIAMGNEIVLNEGESLRGGVKAAVEKGFNVEVKTLPLKRDPQAAADAMNKSIEAATTVYETKNGDRTKVQDGLKDIVQPDFVSSLDAASVATLTALLDWRFVFDEKNTKEQTVTNADGTTSKKKLMELSTGYRVSPATEQHEDVPKMEVSEANGFVFVKIPYDDKIDRSNENHFGPPPSRIYRIVGAPLVGGANRHQALKNMLGQLPANDPVGMRYEDREGKISMARLKPEGKADPFELLAAGGVDAKSWKFPLLESAPVQFTKGVHAGAIEDTEKGSIVQFVTVGGMESLSINMTPPFELKTDVPYYNAIVVELKGAGGELLPMKVAEWTVESFKDAKDPTSTR